MISATVIPLGSDLSSGPSCARAAGGSMTNNIMTGSRTPNRADREVHKGNINRAGRDRNLINSILTKPEHGKKLTAASTPQSRLACRSFAGGGRLQFCLFDWMLSADEGWQDLLFFTCARLPHGLGHSPFHQARKQLVKLDDGDHGPGYDDFTLSFAISAISCLSYSLRRDAAHGLWADVAPAAGHQVRAKLGSDVAGTDGKHVDVVVF